MRSVLPVTRQVDAKMLRFIESRIVNVQEDECQKSKTWHKIRRQRSTNI